MLAGFAVEDARSVSVTAGKGGCGSPPAPSAMPQLASHIQTSKDTHKPNGARLNPHLFARPFK